MGIGEPAKFDMARQLAAALAYIALADLDRVAVVGFAENIVADFPLTRGKAHILGLMKFLEELTPQGRDTSLSEMVRAFVHRSQRRGLVMLISDLFDPTGFELGLNLLRHHRYEPGVLQLYAPRDADPNVLGDVELLDVETESLRKITVTEKNLKQYRSIFRDFLGRAQNYCRNYGMSYTVSSTEVAFDELLLQMMRSAAIAS
jgi:uncharacterized protein (DUF58 family)